MTILFWVVAVIVTILWYGVMGRWLWKKWARWVNSWF